MIKKHLALLATRPQLGRPSMKYPELRELLIAFGRSGYVALYRHDTQHNRIIVLSLRHQREA